MQHKLHYADGLSLSVLSNNMSMCSTFDVIYHASQCVKVPFFTKLSPSYILLMARDFGSDKNGKMKPKLWDKLDSGHGPIAHSLQVPSYSTELLIKIKL